MALANTQRHLTWCKKTAHAIEFRNPSTNVVRAHITQARESIQSMDLNRGAGIVTWTLTTSYYAKYHAVTALFEEFGIKCENHACAVTLFEYLFDNYVARDDIDDFAASKDQRIDAQYYSAVTNVDLEEVANQTKRFVLDIEQLLDDFRAGRQQKNVVEQRINVLKSW